MDTITRLNHLPLRRVGKRPLSRRVLSRLTAGLPKLPEAYVQFLLAFPAVSTIGLDLAVGQQLYPLAWIYGGGMPRREGLSHYVREWEDPSCFPFAEDWANNTYAFLQEGDRYHAVAFIDHDTGETTLVAESFDDFVSNIRVREEIEVEPVERCGPFYSALRILTLEQACGEVPENATMLDVELKTIGCKLEGWDNFSSDEADELEEQTVVLGLRGGALDEVAACVGRWSRKLGFGDWEVVEVDDDLKLPPHLKEKYRVLDEDA